MSGIMRRTLAVLTATLLLTSGAAAAGAQARIEFWTISLQPFFTAYVQGLIARYEQAHPA